MNSILFPIFGVHGIDGFWSFFPSHRILQYIRHLKYIGHISDSCIPKGSGITQAITYRGTALLSKRQIVKTSQKG